VLAPAHGLDNGDLALAAAILDVGLVDRGDEVLLGCLHDLCVKVGARGQGVKAMRMMTTTKTTTATTTTMTTAFGRHENCRLHKGLPFL
jgi:hypothetical protein